MRECWLGPNRRAIGIGLVAPLLLLGAGLALVWFFIGAERFGWLAWLGGLLLAAGGLGLAAMLVLMKQPRLAYADGCLLVFLGTPQPLRVPIELVECFFLGQGPSHLPDTQGKETETQTVVVRLSESAPEWRHREVRPALGHWCDGYIVIRGTWCEPISAGLMQRLNSRLVETHRRRRQGRELETA